MKRGQLEHVLRAAADVTKELEILVIGFSAILGTYDDDRLPDAATRSDEADLAPFRDPDGRKAARIEAALGEGSMFHDTHGYYVDAVDFKTAMGPDGWEGRLRRLSAPNTRGAVGWCLEAHDLAAAKLAAGRDKDYEFVEALLHKKLIAKPTLIDRVDALPADRVLPGLLARAKRWVRAYGAPPPPRAKFVYSAVTFGVGQVTRTATVHLRRHGHADTLCGRTGGKGSTSAITDPAREIGTRLCEVCRRSHRASTK